MHRIRRKRVPDLSRDHVNRAVFEHHVSFAGGGQAGGVQFLLSEVLLIGVCREDSQLAAQCDRDAAQAIVRAGGESLPVSRQARAESA